MKKIPSLFMRNYDGDRLVRDEVTPGCEWVLAGEGIATRKFDGTACMVKDGKLFKRYDAKKGKTPPPNFEPCQEPDAKTGHWPGWIPVGEGKEDRWHREAYKILIGPNGEGITSGKNALDGTYELCGPKINSNPENFEHHILIRHEFEKIEHPVENYNPFNSFTSISSFLEHNDIEGIVWHHPDGRMCKIKKKDFGFKR